MAPAKTCKKWPKLGTMLWLEAEFGRPRLANEETCLRWPWGHQCLLHGPGRSVALPRNRSPTTLLRRLRGGRCAV